MNRVTRLRGTFGRRWVLLGALLLATVLVTLPARAAPTRQAANNESLPEGARIEEVLTNMRLPVAMAFDVSGRLFYTEKTGAVRLYAGGKLQEVPVISFSVNTQGERGLLGIALDPAFAQNHYVYVYLTCEEGPDCPSMENRVVRFTEHDGVGSDPAVIFHSKQTAGNHVGGNIHFGPDSKLYVSVGDNGNAANAQDLGATQGKMHRINPDGSIPGDNPKFDQEGALPSIYAYGLRNSFDFAFDPVVPGRIFASENGPGCDDEVNRIEAGGNYGWRADYPCDDDNPDANVNTIKPLWWIGAGACCVAPTGITVYTGAQIPQWRNHVFMAGYNNGALYHFTPNAGRTAFTGAAVVQGVRANMDIETGPDGALWYLEGGGYTPGTLKRIVGPGTPASPTVPPAPRPTPGLTTAPPPGARSVIFPETGKTVTGLFLDYWEQHGGLAQQGFPISGVMTEVSDLDGKAYTVQYFERAVFEYHPENRAPFDVLLSQLGTFQYGKKYGPGGAPGQAPNNSAGSVLFKETGKRLGGSFLKYWQEHGGLAQQGFPISDEFKEKSDLDGKTYTVQYFERAVFEAHPENQAPFDVLLSQLGTFRYRDMYGGR